MNVHTDVIVSVSTRLGLGRRVLRAVISLPPERSNALARLDGAEHKLRAHEQGSLNTGSDDDGTSAGRDATSGSSTDTPDDAQTQGTEDGDQPFDPLAAAAVAAVARLKRKISARRGARCQEVRGLWLAGAWTPACTPSDTVHVASESMSHPAVPPDDCSSSYSLASQND